MHPSIPTPNHSQTPCPSTCKTVTKASHLSLLTGHLPAPGRLRRPSFTQLAFPTGRGKLRAKGRLTDLAQSLGCAFLEVHMAAASESSCLPVAPDIQIQTGWKPQGELQTFKGCCTPHVSPLASLQPWSLLHQCGQALAWASQSEPKAVWPSSLFG